MCVIPRPCGLLSEVTHIPSATPIHTKKNGRHLLCLKMNMPYFLPGRYSLCGASKQASKQAGNQASRQAGKQAQIRNITETKKVDAVNMFGVGTLR